MREKCDCTVVQLGTMDGPEAAYGLVARLSKLARKLTRKLTEPARKLTEALSTGNLDDATGRFDDVPFNFQILDDEDTIAFIKRGAIAVLELDAAWGGAIVRRKYILQAREPRLGLKLLRKPTV